MPQASIPRSVDVLVVGGGPTGLLITYMLVRSRVKVLTIGEYLLRRSAKLNPTKIELQDQYDKFEQAMYGRACVLHAGSLELLDLNGIYDRIADIGFIVRFVLIQLRDEELKWPIGVQ
jgi:phenol 2-monooxygenase